MISTISISIATLERQVRQEGRSREEAGCNGAPRHVEAIGGAPFVVFV